MSSGKPQNRHFAALKKNVVGLIGILTALSVAACGQVKEDEMVNDEMVNIEDFAANQQESDIQAGESADSEIIEDEIVNAEELLDSFINGSISADDSADLTSAFYISDLNMNAGEWDSFSVGEKVDLDNDGENELIMNGPYGGIYLDARDNRVYKFAAGDGNACILSYTYFNGDVWILYSNGMNVGYESYHMEKFEGADNLAAEINFGEEPANLDRADSEMNYTWNGTAISYDEYTALCSKIFAAEVSTQEIQNLDTNESLDAQNKESSDGQIKKDDEPESLAGEYEYQSDYGTGKLMIKETSYGYDISDYESEASYRFLADSSNIEIIKDNRIYIKYPEQAFSDDTVIFRYYILEYRTDGINVYYAESADEEGQFLYHAARKSEGGTINN